MTQKPPTIKTALKRIPCNGCPGKIEIGQQMIVVDGVNYYHQLCFKTEGHKK